MKTAAMICEFNPFHNGHRALIEAARKAGATHILAVMSGNFVQRGDVAVFDKFTRAKIALENGADLVAELPERVSLTSAEGFARGAADIITALGCADMLAFGSECGDIVALREAAGAAAYAVKSEEFSEQLRRGKSYPAALDAALRQFYTPDVAELVASPNNTLAVEYISAFDDLGSNIEMFTVKRGGAAHDASEADSGTGYASGSAVRKMILSGEEYSAFAPACGAPAADISRLERAILAKLRTVSKDEFSGIYDCAGKARVYTRSGNELQRKGNSRRVRVQNTYRHIAESAFGNFPRSGSASQIHGKSVGYLRARFRGSAAVRERLHGSPRHS